tara:strand:+ start:2055 stop:2756 length:702 start_codon:yes stop_codon:yes gene_type:complete
MKMKDKTLLGNLFANLGVVEGVDTWDCHGTPVISHKALERVAEQRNITFDDPVVIESDPEKKICVMRGKGQMWEMINGQPKQKEAWSTGEATPYNNKNTYPYAMAEKRLKDRLILKLVGVSGYVYSEDESDDFKRPPAKLSETKFAILMNKVKELPEDSEIRGRFMKKYPTRDAMDDSKFDEIWKFLNKGDNNGNAKRKGATAGKRKVVKVAGGSGQNRDQNTPNHGEKPISS